MSIKRTDQAYFSSKTKILHRSTLKTPKNTRLQDDNSFQPYVYHHQAWLLGTFGNKDETSDARYFRFKAEAAAFASECYRLLTDVQSPKYRSAVIIDEGDETTPASIEYGFLTKRIENPVTLKTLFTILDKLTHPTNMHSDFYLSCWEKDVAIFLEQTIEKIANWHAATLLKMQTLFECLQHAPITVINYAELCQKFERFLATNQQFLINRCHNELSTHLAAAKTSHLKPPQRSNKFRFTIPYFQHATIAHEEPVVSNGYPFDAFIKELENLHRSNVDSFYSSQLQPYANQLSHFITQALQSQRFGALLAIAYALGEASFKTRDIIFDGKLRKMYKIDHERCLSAIGMQLQETIRAESAGDNEFDASLQELFFSSNIDSFPTLSIPKPFWPTDGREFNNMMPTILTDAWETPEFKQQAYLAWCAFVLLPDKMLAALAHLFFDPKHSMELTTHLQARKLAILKCLKHSASFQDYLMQEETLEQQIAVLYTAHNARWAKEKYADLQLSVGAMRENLQAWRKKSHKVHMTQLEHVYNITPPRLKS